MNASICLLAALVGLSTAGCADDDVTIPPTPRDNVASASSHAASSIPADPILAELQARPSILDAIEITDGCPVSRPEPVTGAGFQALGSEPLFAPGLSPAGEWDGAVDIDGIRYLEVNWLSPPSHRSPLLVRGSNLETGTRIEFRSPDRLVTEDLYLTTSTSTEAESLGPGYRTWRSFVSVPEPGCYGLQVEGIGHFGGYAIVIEVR